ncbi:phosphoglycerate mutase [Candidatus Aerophobetes bacterium]|uniref:2,3-bisphosphoglycerate-dependent phosphoglycerate mutase n=1 Tax=Aerophobetes bacterium TaxID=2030807 RepID=A0A2A4X2B9_UNCAE|nr:MAG: phosphoglycerate mutase [Candidatus Aerophobetes bacterium]
MSHQGQLILLRHGKSVWNEKNLFTGWVDIPLSQKGIDEALEAGKLIKNIAIDVVFTSTLIRASMTAALAMSQHSSNKILVRRKELESPYSNWDQDYCLESSKTTIDLIENAALNERMYGQLQGFNKDAMREVHGAEQVHIWRRSFDVAPPGGESLKMCAERTLPYFESVIKPEIEKGRNVLIAAHGNSLRAIVMEIEKMSPEQILEFEIPTGKPLFYRFEKGVIRREEG